nr:MAG TPA: hypothetical protein [Caudoviricetes sp.]
MYFIIAPSPFSWFCINSIICIFKSQLKLF